jgi:hypothetical protein
MCRKSDERNRSVKATFRILPVLLGCLMTSIGTPVRSQTDGERVQLIMSGLPPHGSTSYQAIKKRAGKATGQALPLTRSEMWSVPKASAEAVRTAAQAHGSEVHKLGSDWNRLFSPAPADLQLNPQQKAMVDQIMAAKATQRVNLMLAPAPSKVEYALTAEAANKKAASVILLSLGEDKTLAVARRSVDIRSDMCVWRGTVEGTGMPVTIMWWPQGKMTASVQQEGRLYSIRHLGGEIHAVIEMAEERMPDDHPAGRRMEGR